VSETSEFSASSVGSSAFSSFGSSTSGAFTGVSTGAFHEKGLITLGKYSTSSRLTISPFL
jgi:hypothetical protein